jgi:hypothetical protein
VAAGGPGMAESWIVFPHLAWAITEPVVTGGHHASAAPEPGGAT